MKIKLLLVVNIFAILNILRGFLDPYTDDTEILVVVVCTVEQMKSLKFIFVLKILLVKSLSRFFCLSCSLSPPNYFLDCLSSAQVFLEYFKELEEESIRDNFVIIYELLDELMDFGYPQTTDSKILQE